MDAASSQTADQVATYKQISNCRLCGGHRLNNVLNLGDVPLPLFKPPLELVPTAPLELMRCFDCSLLQLKHSVDRDSLFRTYWYRSGINQTMKDALSDVVNQTCGFSTGPSGIWLDIGANDGTLLDFVPEGYEKWACEPARTFSEELVEKKFKLLDDYFHAIPELEGKCSVISSLAMFYDLDQPDLFVSDIAKCLTDDGVWVNQLSHTPYMLRDNAFDNICHEHVSYWDLHTLTELYVKHGLVIKDVYFNDVNGGSVRTYAVKSKQRGNHFPATSAEEAFDFADRVRRWRILMSEVLDGKRVWGYGASTKGVTLLSYLGHRADLVAIADRNERKHGLWMPGTRIPIVPEKELRDAAPDYAMVLPWAFEKEFNEREKQLRRSGTKLLYPLPNPRIVL